MICLQKPITLSQKPVTALYRGSLEKRREEAGLERREGRRQARRGVREGGRERE